MTPNQRWTLRTDRTSYTVRLSPDGPWAELDAWGPLGVETGPSALDWSHRTHFITPADAAPAEYLPYGLRPFTGAELVAARPGTDRGVWWDFEGATEEAGSLRLAFTDEVLGLRTVLCYATVPGTDVIHRWTELSRTGDGELWLERFDSAAVNVPVTAGARLTYLAGQWSQEFQRTQLTLSRGTFTMGSRQGVPGHAYAPWLAVQDAAGPGDAPAYGLALEWPGNWHLTAEAEPGGAVRIRAGRVPHEGRVRLTPGDTLTTPRLACAFSAEGLDGLSRVWHRYERRLTGERLHRPRKVLYNSWEATAFDVDAAGQLELAKAAADIGAELFVVDDGWFTGRADDTGGLGDWYPDPVAFPQGFGRFVADVRALGLDFGLWIEPEAVSPGSALYAEHPDWVYRIDGRPARLVRHQLLLDLGRTDVQDFVIATLDRLLTGHDISYLKWDMNRPPTERGRPGAGPADHLDLDAQHVAGYLRVLDRLRTAHPRVTVEGCAGGGARVDHATIARTDVVWPSDNTAPLDRLAVQYGFLHAHAPHVMSSWVTDAPGVFDPRPRSLAFRFVTAMCGVLGIGADLRRWDAGRRAEAARWIARYKEVRDVVHLGEARLLGSPLDATCGVQYDGPDGRTVVAALGTGRLDGAPLVPGRPARLRLRGVDPAARYRDAASATTYSGAHLLHYGLPFAWSAEHDAELVVLTRQ
ncbi:alpha-galactosidase [Streptomyces rapamycinicus]|uniref:Alpha-galactosidase n=2 Tax=Streptomyces rapamycinicus TaxID=1226757 RepID=A0A0A0N5T3_STRRN|nr:alpha-galactosidase [Streptomyces rapamycinicus]AGP54487.1 alpha-galactosidase [Streptomyces rapamycinicus NRRL 5491]MBB4781994.1 alpha-galactosidase [Streptomyces rapamycinicus]RLV73364.1 alpha-galactosidase [Streptomyces rapamycinicus NRRL 5491]UTO62541.1 alpha-galactosidase [Streptomyces rapamycinicus]UTP30496.1 alpha-galactosidase [Streptomyces rapamycinicus NRRL 5491]